MMRKIAVKRNSCIVYSVLQSVCKKHSHYSSPLRKSIPVATKSISYINVYHIIRKQCNPTEKGGIAGVPFSPNLQFTFLIS